MRQSFIPPVKKVGGGGGVEDFGSRDIGGGFRVGLDKWILGRFKDNGGVK